MKLATLCPTCDKPFWTKSAVKMHQSMSCSQTTFVHHKEHPVKRKLQPTMYGPKIAKRNDAAIRAKPPSSTSGKVSSLISKEVDSPTVRRLNTRADFRNSKGRSLVVTKMIKHARQQSMQRQVKQEGYTLVDTHIHLGSMKQQSWTQILKMEEDGYELKGCVNIVHKPEQWVEELEYCRKHPNVYAAIGVHPNLASSTRYEQMENLFKLVPDPKCVAIGETGLDYERSPNTRWSQMKVLQEHLLLAKETGKTLVLHLRGEGVVKDLCAIAPKLDTPVVIHCCTLLKEEVSRIGSLFSYMFFGIGPLILKRCESGNRVIKLVEHAPMDQLLVESDAPYMMEKGKRYTPSILAGIVKKIMSVRGVHVRDTKKTCRALNANAKAAYRINLKSPVST